MGMYKDLSGKVAIVTGAATGLGEGIARRYLSEGMKVVANFHNAKHRDGAEKLVSEFGQDNCVAVQADISTETGVKALADAALENFGGFDVWVSNAGVEYDYTVSDTPLDTWNKVMNVNLTGVFLGCREAIRHFQSKGKPGNLIAISSIHSFVPWAGFASYDAAKGAVTELMKTIAQEVSNDGIRANCIAPGAINTPINKEKFADETKKKAVTDMIPMGLIGDVEDVSAAAAWLASNESKYVTASTIIVDGGMSNHESFRFAG